VFHAAIGDGAAADGAAGDGAGEGDFTGEAGVTAGVRRCAAYAAACCARLSPPDGVG